MSRSTSVIRCPHCAWRARLVADTPHEVTEFLARLLAEHLMERHKERMQ